MMTKTQLIANLKIEFPVIKEGSDQQGYVELLGKEYDARIAEWAENILAKEAADAAKAEALGAKAALLEKLGITQEEAKLLFA